MTPNWPTPRQFCAAYGYAPEDSANTIVVVGKSTPPVYAACVVLATTRLDVNGVVRRRLGTRKASFASAEETKAITGMLIGGVTAFGLPADLPLWVDAQCSIVTASCWGAGAVAASSSWRRESSWRSPRPRSSISSQSERYGQHR